MILSCILQASKTDDSSLLRLAEQRRWRQCQQCRYAAQSKLQHHSHDVTPSVIAMAINLVACTLQASWCLVRSLLGGDGTCLHLSTACRSAQICTSCIRATAAPRQGMCKCCLTDLSVDNSPPCCPRPCGPGHNTIDPNRVAVMRCSVQTRLHVRHQLPVEAESNNKSS